MADTRETRAAACEIKFAIELSYRAGLKDEEAAGELVKALNRIDGVQGVSLARMDSRVD